MTSRNWLTLLATCALLTLGATSAQARKWTDATGKYSVEADLVMFNDNTVILKKENHELASMPIKELSKADQAYIRTKEVQEAMGKAADQYQTWKFRDGTKAVGRVVEYGRKDVAVQRRRDRLYVNDRLYDNLPEIYQKMVLQIVSHFENIPINNRKDLYDWAVKLGGNAGNFTCEGIKLELENGDVYGIPFFLIADEDLRILKPGWEKWAAAEHDAEQRKQQQFMLEAQARAYQQDHEASRQIAMFNAMSDWIDLWEVQLLPRQGVGGGARTTVVPATDSRQAAATAAEQNPNYITGAMRKISRKN